MKFVKKPVVVEARQFTGGGSNGVELVRWAFPHVSWHSGVADVYNLNGTLWRAGHSEHIKIKTLEGEMTALPGAWLIQGVEGEFYACDEQIFEKTYEEAEEKNADPSFPEEA